MSIKLKRKKRGVEALRSHYGRMFVLPWVIGLLLFFVVPLASSIIYSFCRVNIIEGGVTTTFVGLEHYKYAINSDPQYLTLLKKCDIGLCCSASHYFGAEPYTCNYS